METLQTETETKAVRHTSLTRASLLGHLGGVIWLTGLSGAGKSTIARALEHELLTSGILAAVIDGDQLRTGLSSDLDFSESGRRENIRRATELAGAMAGAGVVVIAALISPLRDDRMRCATRLQQLGISFLEVFISAPLDVCETRDPKGLYRKARLGQIGKFTGIDSPYEPPLTPDLEIRTDLESVETSVQRVYSRTCTLVAANRTLRTPKAKLALHQ